MPRIPPGIECLPANGADCWNAVNAEANSTNIRRTFRVDRASEAAGRRSKRRRLDEYDSDCDTASTVTAAGSRHHNVGSFIALCKQQTTWRITVRSRQVAADLLAEWEYKRSTVI